MPELLAYIDALIEGGGNLPERRQGDLLKPVFLEHSNEVKQFFASYLRRDLADVFDGQPEAFLKAAERCLKIFRNPKSKQGIQKLS
ncbi:hypothetical protein APY03_6880 [Variovorax sp. WDL1]|nr:hypothetical protein APY03_6880 [Variovorax sp. WDL1]